RGLGLLLSRADLLVVEERQHLARLHWVAFADAHLAESAAGLGGHRGVVSLDAPAYGDDLPGRGGTAEQDVPGAQRDQAHEEEQDDGATAPARAMGQGRRRGWRWGRRRTRRGTAVRHRRRVRRPHALMRRPGRRGLLDLVRRHGPAPLARSVVDGRASTARPRVMSSWTCRTYSAAGRGLRGGSVAPASRSRNGAVAKKNRRLPTRLR